MDFTGTLPRRYSGETQEVVSPGGKTPKRTEHYLNDRGLHFVFCGGYWYVAFPEILIKR